MKRFLVFNTPRYESQGGLGDMVGQLETVEECKRMMVSWVNCFTSEPTNEGIQDKLVNFDWESYKYDGWQIYDCVLEEIVFDSNVNKMSQYTQIKAEENGMRKL